MLMIYGCGNFAKAKRCEAECCDNIFYTKDPRKRFCSRKCRDRDLSPLRHGLKCIGCKVEFSSRNQKQTYCSVKCRVKRWHTHCLETRIKNAKVMKCQHCGDTFGRWTLRNFCSYACKDAFFAKPTKGGNCKQCGSAFTYASYHTVEFCSKRCRNRKRGVIQYAKLARPKLERICAWCKTAFMTAHHMKRFCCPEHAYQADLENNRQLRKLKKLSAIGESHTHVQQVEVPVLRPTVLQPGEQIHQEATGS